MTYQISVFPLLKLSEYAEIFPGYAFKSEGFTEDPADLPLVKGENVHQGFIDWVGAKRWPKSESAHLSRYLLKPGDIVLAMDRPWVTAGLKWSYIKEHDPVSLLVQRVARLRAKKGLNQTYLRCVISSLYFSKYIEPIVTGVNVPHISGKQIGDFRIPVPSLPIQEKISSLIAAYDDLIENNKRRIAILEKMAEEIYREWFVRMRFPASAKATAGKSSRRTNKGLPVGWFESRLGDEVTFTMGQSPKSEHYNTIGDGLPFNQGVGTYGERFPKREIYCSSTGRKAKTGDILFSVRAPVGRLNIADCEMIIGRGLAAIRHKKNFNSYLYYLLKVAFASEDIIGNGSIFNSVGKDELARFPILQPPEPLVAQYNELASNIDKEIELLIRATDNLTQTRDLLLPRLISGKLSVENLELPSNVSSISSALPQVELAHA